MHANVRFRMAKYVQFEPIEVFYEETALIDSRGSRTDDGFAACHPCSHVRHVGLPLGGEQPIVAAGLSPHEGEQHAPGNRTQFVADLGHRERPARTDAETRYVLVRDESEHARDAIGPRGHSLAARR
jgi:hypothetical protein